MDDGSDKKTRQSALIITTLANFLTPLAVSALNVALPAIAAEFSMDAILLGWVPTAYILSASIMLVPAGKLADIYGRRRIFALGAWVFTAVSLLLAFCSSPFQLIILRVFQGVASAMIFGPATAILTSVFPAGERGRVLGINVAAAYLGLSFGPFIGGIITQYAGWRGVFLINVPLGVVIGALATFKVKGEWTSARGEAFDIAGSLVYAAMLFTLMYGISLLPSRNGLGFIAASVILAAGFVRMERKSKSPLVDISIFMSNRSFAFSNAAALINYAATFSTSFLLSLYLQHIRGLSPQSAGLMLVAQPIVQTIFSPLAGRLSDRIEPAIVASSGMALTAAGLFLLSFLGPGTSSAFIIASLMLLGFGFALFSSPNVNAIMSSVESRFYGVASSMVATMRMLGQMFSMGIAMCMFALYMGRSPIVPGVYPLLLRSTKMIFVIFGILCICGIGASWARGKIRT